MSGGLVLFLGCSVVWWTRRQKSVSASSAQAEYFAAALASREGSYVRDLVADLGYPLSGPTPLMLDSKSAIDLAFDPVAFKRTKHILRVSALPYDVCVCPTMTCVPCKCKSLFPPVAVISSPD